MTERPRNGDSVDSPFDKGVARAYRDAAREAPPQELDAAILAAARREVQARPRALDEGGFPPGGVRDVPPPRRRWHVPLAVAAVLVLSVSIVTLHREEPQLSRPAVPRSEPPAAPELRDTPRAAPEHPRSQAPARKPSPEAAREAMRIPEPSPRAEIEERRNAASETAASKAEEADREAQPLFRGQAAEAPQRAGGGAAPAAPAAALADEPPEEWGERIMALRRDGKADEADALLAQFRKRYPGHPVPEAWQR